MACGFLGSLGTKDVKATVTDHATFSASSNDGYIYTYSGTYTGAHNNTVGATSDYSVNCFIGQDYYGSTYEIMRGFVFFDTSSLPDDITITESILGIYVNTNLSTTDFNVTIQSGAPIYPHDTLEDGDYYYGWYSGNGGSRNTSTISALNYWNVTLNDSGKGWIETDGTTKLSLRSSRDINYIAPYGVGEILIYMSEKGSIFAPKLYVTYTLPDYNFNYILHGPYFEDGVGSNVKIKVTLFSEYESPITFNLPNGTYAGTYAVGTENRPNHFLWNISAPAYNESRYFWLTNAVFEEIYVTRPITTDPFYLYTVTIVDLVGASNGYLECLLTFSGSEHIIARQSYTLGNPIPFYLSQGHHYTFKLTCDQGVKQWSNIIPEADTNINLIVTTSDLTPPLQSLNVSYSVNRINDTWVRAEFTDNQVSTTSGVVTIFHYNNITRIADTSQTYTNTSWTFDWYSAIASMDYWVNLTILKDGSYYTWIQAAPALNTGTNPMIGMFDWLGVWPVPPEFILAQLITLTLLACVSAGNIGVGLISVVVLNGVLVYMHWTNLSWAAIGLAMCFAVAETIHLAKKKG